MEGKKSHLRTIFFLAVILAVVAIVWAGFYELVAGGGSHDVTHEPAYGFEHLAGTIWKTKVRFAFAERGSVTALEEYSEFNLAEHDRLMADPSYSPGHRVVAILEPGTQIRIDRLIDIRGTVGGYRTEGRVLSGPSANRDLKIDKMFTANDYLFPFESLPKTWEVAPDKFEKL